MRCEERAQAAACPSPTRMLAADHRRACSATGRAFVTDGDVPRRGRAGDTVRRIGYREGARLRHERGGRRPALHVGERRADLPQQERPRLLPEPRALASVLTTRGGDEIVQRKTVTGRGSGSVWAWRLSLRSPRRARSAAPAARRTRRVALPPRSRHWPSSSSEAARVTSAPAGISCPGKCAATFAAGSRVLLTPKSKGGSRFLRWGGDCTGAGACRVRVSALAAVAAEFVGSKAQPLRPQKTADVSPAPTRGAGSAATPSRSSSRPARGAC